MATITIYANSPEAPSPIALAGWDTDFAALGANRTSAGDAVYVVYNDPNDAVDQASAEGIVGAGWFVTIA